MSDVSIMVQLFAGVSASILAAFMACFVMDRAGLFILALMSFGLTMAYHACLRHKEVSDE